MLKKIGRKIGRAIFGKDEQEKGAELLDPEQKKFRDLMLGQASQHIPGTFNALGGYATEMYDPYDRERGDEVFGALRDALVLDTERAKRDFRNTNIGSRFSYARSAGEGAMDQELSKHLADLDYTNLQHKTQAAQQGYQNQIAALQNILGTSQGLFTPTAGAVNTHSPGALDYIGAWGAAKKSLFG